MIYTLTFNPSLDYIVTVPKFICGMVTALRKRLFSPVEKESMYPWC